MVGVHCPATLSSRRRRAPPPALRICISYLLRRCGRQMAQAWDGSAPPSARREHFNEVEGSRKALCCITSVPACASRASFSCFCARDAWWASCTRLFVSLGASARGSLLPHANTSAGRRERCIIPITLLSLCRCLASAWPVPTGTWKIDVRMRDASLVPCRDTQRINLRKTSMCLGRWRVATLQSFERLSSKI